MNLLIARGVATSTLLGENLVEQVATRNRESPDLLDKQARQRGLESQGSVNLGIVVQRL